ncbi:MAG: hypothetical protein KKF48_02210 [Nanoarchaeota archaeon]|nr:hypothetical protein [Nanoarchaeota archaeon]MBU1027833.1 hypothetical protein [Nanoarchaeota archaeon]
MTKIIPRDLIKHLEWKPGQATAPITPATNFVPQNIGSFNTDNVNYSFLEGDVGRQVLEEYNQLVQREYQNASALQKLSFAGDVVKGSNPFAFVLLNKVLQNHGKWVARPVDLEKCLKEGSLNLRDTYGDSGLVLRSENNPNGYLAENLASQVKGRGYNVGGDAVMIPLAGFDLAYDSNSPQDLVFQLTDSSEIIYAPQLNKINPIKKFNGADEQGLPIFEDAGSRTLYSSEDEGLCRLYRYGDLYLNAGDRDLADSDEDGRVIICAEGTSS